MHQSKADTLLDNHWDGLLPIDPVIIANRLGIRVQSRLNAPYAVRYVVEEGRPTINYNASERTPVQRFAVARALGHHALGHGTDITDTRQAFRVSNPGQKSMSANLFAMSFLIPERHLMFLIMNKGVTDIAKLASTFGVSPVTIHYRLRFLGML